MNSNQIRWATTLFLVIVLFNGCQDTSANKEPVEDPVPEEKPKISIAKANGKWKNWVNKQASNAQEVYMADAVKLDLNGNAGYVSDSTYQVIQELPQVDTIISKHLIEAGNEENRFTYEIGVIHNKDGGIQKQLVIWDTNEKQPKRLFEFIATADSEEVDFELINSRRAQWIELCNQHNAKKLVHEIYAENVVYYNHKPPVIGRDAVSVEYQYMNREAYSLHLEPIAIEPVNEHLVYEIGQCSGSYKGKYIFIWQKDSEGKWYVLMDSNY